MNWDRIEQNWKHFKVQAKRNWDRLSENELLQINGNRDELCSKVQQAYGIGRSEANLQIDEWLSTLGRPASTAPLVGGQSQRQSGF